MNYYIGLMTGTSMDGVDGVLVSIPDDYQSGFLPLKEVAHVSYNDAFRRRMMALQKACYNEIENELLTANDLAHLYAKCVHTLLNNAQLEPKDIKAIGVHGQTIRHRPELGFTKQTNNPALLAELTNIDVIADFRSRDIAAGGQGAPLVPAFHKVFFANKEESIVVVNIGGIANISVIDKQGKILGFDTGPGNVLIDLWAFKHTGKLYDEDGAWAKSGVVHHRLLDVLLNEPFLKMVPPKSTGRDLFNEVWLNQKLAHFDYIPLENVQATLTAYTVQTIVNAIVRYGVETKTVYLCGGGAKNAYLVDQFKAILKRDLPNIQVETTDVKGIDPTHIEGLAFAWLAHCFILRKPANLPQVTGAKGPRILGALYPR